LRGVVGLDESNHGRWPEIIVGVWSSNLNLVVPTSARAYVKRRSQTNPDALRKYVADKDFRYVVIPQDYAYLGRERLVGVSFAAIIQEFSEDPYGELEQALIDGSPVAQTQKVIERLLDSNISVDYLAKGDSSVQLLNQADRLAYFLFKLHTIKKYSRSRVTYSDRLLHPDFSVLTDLV